MCNRYNIKTSLKSIVSELDAKPAFDFEIAGEVFPLAMAPTLVINRAAQRELRPMTFGLTPPGKTRDQKMPPFNNARIESRHKWPWKTPFEKYRCIVPMDSFREPCYWGESAGKEVNFRRADGKLLLATAIFSVTTSDKDESELSMSLIMRPALPTAQSLQSISRHGASSLMVKQAEDRIADGHADQHDLRYAHLTVPIQQVPHLSGFAIALFAPMLSAVRAFAIDPHVEAVTRTVRAAKAKVERPRMERASRLLALLCKSASLG